MLDQFNDWENDHEMTRKENEDESKFVWKILTQLGFVRDKSMKWNEDAGYWSQYLLDENWDK